MKDIIENIKNWCEDLYYSFRNRIKFHLNKRHIAVVQEAYSGYPYDYAFLLQLEYCKLQEILDYHEHSYLLADEYRNDIIKTLKWAISMLNIILGNVKTYHYDGDLEFKEESNSTYTMVKRPVYHCDVKVNMRNLSHFVPDEKNQKVYKRFPSDFYELKAKHLYYKIREQYTDMWWD